MSQSSSSVALVELLLGGDVLGRLDGGVRDLADLRGTLPKKSKQIKVNKQLTYQKVNKQLCQLQTRLT